MSLPLSRFTALPHIQARTYRPHALHGGNCVWTEKNCYVDVIIELVHALGMEPLAMLPFTLAVDFEGDQWTFFKPRPSELRQLYGIDVQEMTVWRPLIDHAAEHLAAGRLIATEADAFWMPDTAGTDYRRQHVKSTMILADLDVEAMRLGYFHNAGYHEMQGEDLLHTLRMDASPDPARLPLFAELVRVDRAVQQETGALAAMSWGLAATHLVNRPATNPVERFAERFARDLPLLHEKGLDHYHAWAFATIRQAGAAFELSAAWLHWLRAVNHLPDSAALSAAMAGFQTVSQTNKALILKVARAVNAKRAVNIDEAFGEMARGWATGMDALASLM